MPDSPTPLLDVRDLDLAFGGTTVLSDVCLAVGEDETVGIIGPNGAGKTALINCVTGVYPFQRGAIAFAGLDVTGADPRRLVSLGLVRTFQHPEMLIDELTVEESVLLGRHSFIRNGVLSAVTLWPRGRRSERESRAVVRDLLTFMGLWGERDARVVDLPYGLQKLVELTRALAMEPRLLILDEPAAGMPSDEKVFVADHVRRIRAERGISVALIEHDVDMVVHLSDRVVVLVAGRLIAQGLPAAVLADPAVRSAYLGEVAVPADPPAEMTAPGGRR